MDGTIQNDGTEYWWWSGPANDGAKEGFCVHCRNSTYGVTKYMDTEPDELLSESTAKQLIPMVNGLR